MRLAATTERTATGAPNVADRAAPGASDEPHRELRHATADLPVATTQHVRHATAPTRRTLQWTVGLVQTIVGERRIVRRARRDRTLATVRRRVIVGPACHRATDPPVELGPSDPGS
ncbi:MAG: hypothetical protein ABSA07_03855 [Acidimicrobiales bacterium]